jgi:hypothetical protein
MRNYALLMAATVFGLLGFHAGSVSAASSNTNATTVRFSFTASMQGPIQAVTNGTATNVISKLNKFRFTNKDMLTLLASEFSTVFPDGAQLGMVMGSSSFDFVVLDKAGNILRNVSTNLSDSSYVFNITNNSSSVAAGIISMTSNKTTETITQIQPDFTFYYADGKGNYFHFGGLATLKLNALLEGGTVTLKTISVMISGSGGGTVFNPGDDKYDKVVLTGPFIATGANIAAP